MKTPTGSEELGLVRFVAKIGLGNAPSRQLFRSLGFVHESTAEVFQEETLVLLNPSPAVFAAVTTVRTRAAPDDCVSAG